MPQLRIQVGRHAGAFIESQLFGAKESVRICSPWISPRYVRWLFSLAKDGVSIRVITADFEKNEEAVQLISEYVEGQSRLVPAEQAVFSALIIGGSSIESGDRHFDYGVHAKIYIIDGSYAVTGSANLTHSGFSNNIELLTICDPPEVPDLERKYDELWALYEREPNVFRMDARKPTRGGHSPKAHPAVPGSSAPSPSPPSPSPTPPPISKPASPSLSVSSSPSPSLSPSPRKVDGKKLEQGMAFERYVRSLLDANIGVI